MVAKTEVSYTKGVEGLLESLQGPLDIVHTVDPTEAARSFEKWTPSVLKELKSFDPAINKVSSEDSQVIKDIEDGAARIVPMEFIQSNLLEKTASKKAIGSDGNQELWPVEICWKTLGGRSGASRCGEVVSCDIQ